MPRTRLHDCAGSCGGKVGKTRTFCHPCWIALPVHLRRAGKVHPQSTAYRIALDDAAAWHHGDRLVRTGGN